MLRWALLFTVLAIVAGILGFGGFATGVAQLAKVLFYAFAVAAGAIVVARITQRS